MITVSEGAGNVQFRGKWHKGRAQQCSIFGAAIDHAKPWARNGTEADQLNLVAVQYWANLFKSDHPAMMLSPERLACGMSFAQFCALMEALNFLAGKKHNTAKYLASSFVYWVTTTPRNGFTFRSGVWPATTNVKTLLGILTTSVGKEASLL